MKILSLIAALMWLPARKSLLYFLNHFELKKDSTQKLTKM